MHHLFLLSPLLFSLFMVAEVFVLTFLKQARLLQWGQDFFVFCFVLILQHQFADVVKVGTFSITEMMVRTAS